MDQVQKLNNPNCYTPSSEPYRIQGMNYGIHYKWHGTTGDKLQWSEMGQAFDWSSDWRRLVSSPSYPTGPYCRFLQMPTRLVFWVLTVYSLVCGYQRSGWRAETSQFGGVRCTLHPYIDLLQLWRWRRYVPPKRRWPAIMLHSVAAQRTTIRIYAAMSG
jgi:hypothetical protein